MERVKVAVVGTGGIFKWAHLNRALVHLPEAQLVALCDINADALASGEAEVKAAYQKRAEELRQKGETAAAQAFTADMKALKSYNDVDRMLSDASPDIVDVCTPPIAHASVAVKCLSAGSHVMCEKPMARTYLETLPVVEAARKSGRFYQHNENWIWDPQWYTMRKVIEGGYIGEPVAMFLSGAHGGPEGNPAFWNAEMQGGGAIIDMAIHPLTTSWFLAGLDMKPVSVKVALPMGIARRFKDRIIGGRFRSFEAEDCAHFLVRFEHPETSAWVTSMIEGSWCYRSAPENAVVGTAGTAVFGPRDEQGKSSIIIRKATGGETSVPVSGPTWEEYPSSYYGEIRNFIRSVQAGEKPLVDEKVGSESQAIVGAAYRSQANGGAAVSLQEFKNYAVDLERQHGKKASQVMIEEALWGMGS